MKQSPTASYVEKAKLLSREEVEQLFSRMGRRTAHRLDRDKLTPLEAVALQLEKEDRDLEEWRARWSEIQEQDKKKRKGK